MMKKTFTFQFLLGRLETVGHAGRGAGVQPFQFLLGRLETTSTSCRLVTITCFNSS